MDTTTTTTYIVQTSAAQADADAAQAEHERRVAAIYRKVAEQAAEAAKRAKKAKRASGVYLTIEASKAIQGAIAEAASAAEIL